MRLVRIAFAIVGSVVMVATATASTPFEFYVIDLGGYRNNLCELTPFTSSAGRIYQHPRGNNYPPQPEAIAAQPNLEFDSYIATGGSPSTLGHAAITPASVLGGSTYCHFADLRTYIDNSDWSQPLRHAWFTPFPYGGPRVFSSPGPGGNQAVFIARLTIDRNASLSSHKFAVNGVDLSTGQLIGFICRLNGTSVQLPVDIRPAAPANAWLRIRSYLADRVTLPDFGEADVYDLYIESFDEPDEPWFAEGPCGTTPAEDPDNPNGFANREDFGQPDEPNDVLTEAVHIGNEVPLQTLNDRFDYFRYPTDQRGTVTFEATFAGADGVNGQARLFSPSGVVLQVADITHGTLAISGSGNPGQYFLEIRRDTGSGPYMLFPSFTPDAPADTNADGVTTAADVYNILSTWNTFIAAIGPGDINADLNGDYTVGRPDLEIVLRALGFDREDYTPKSWKKAMKTFYTRQVRPVESFPAGTPPRLVNQTRKAMQQRLEAAQP